MEMRSPEGAHVECHLLIAIAVILPDRASAPRETAMRHAILARWARNLADTIGDLIVLASEGADGTG